MAETEEGEEARLKWENRKMGRPGRMLEVEQTTTTTIMAVDTNFFACLAVILVLICNLLCCLIYYKFVLILTSVSLHNCLLLLCVCVRARAQPLLRNSGDNVLIFLLLYLFLPNILFNVSFFT